MAQRWENRFASIGGHLKRLVIFQKLGMNRDFDFDVRFILDKRERSFHEVYILPFEPREIAQAGSWSERQQRPVILNEFGVLRWKAAPTDRARWLRTVRSAAEDACVGWAHWDYADGFGFMRRTGDREVPDPISIDALLERGAKRR